MLTLRGQVVASGLQGSSDIYSDEQSVTIVPPESPRTPVVVLRSPATLSYCDDLFLDFSSSAGNAGQPWQNVSFVLQETKSEYNRLIIMAIIVMYMYCSKCHNYFTSSTLYDITDSIVSQSNYIEAYGVKVTSNSGILQSGRTYIFTVTLCNFLEICGIGTQTLSITSAPAPYFTISGGSEQRYVTTEPLSLTTERISDGSISGNSSCPLRDPNKFSYSWQVLKVGISRIPEVI